MTTLESRLENAKKAVEVAKETYEKAKPTLAKFKETGYHLTNENDIEKWVKYHRNSKEKLLQPAIKALKALEVAKAKLRRAEVKVYNKNAGTRRSKRRSNKTRRSV
jgi:hypothetical protein